MTTSTCERDPDGVRGVPRAGGRRRGRDASARELDRRLRLAVLWEKRQAVTALRDANEIDDIVLRELQAAMDVEEVRLLGPSAPD